MKRKIILALFLICIATGCGKGKTDALTEQNINNAGESTEKTENSAESETTPEAKAYDSEIISDMYAKDGTLTVVYDEDNSYEFEYSYHVPQIDEDTEGAEEINALIHESYDSVMQDIYQDIDSLDGNTYEPTWAEISYEVCQNGSIFSILISAHANFEDFVCYDIYNYDAASGERLDNENLLSIHQIRNEDFLTLARITAVKEWDAMFESTKEYMEESDFTDGEGGYYERLYAEYMGSRLATIKDSSSEDGIPLYLNENGELSGVFSINVPAGGGFFYSLIPLERDLSEWENMKSITVPKEYLVSDFFKTILGLYGEEGYTYDFTYESADGNSYDGGYYIGFDSNDESVFLIQKYGEDFSVGYEGKLQLTGMDEKGFILEYEVTVSYGEQAGEKNTYEGTFYLNPDSFYDEETGDWHEYAVYRHIDGDDIFDSRGKDIKMIKTYG